MVAMRRCGSAASEGAAQQAAGVGVRRRRKHFSHRAGLHDAPRVHHRHAVGNLRHHAEVVGNQQQGQAQALPQLGQQRQNLRLDSDVQRRCRLVGDEQQRPAHQGHGNQGALPKTAGELVRILFHATFRVRDGHLAHHFQRRGARLAARDLLVRQQRFGNLVADFHHRVQGGHRLLEDHGDSGAANAAHLLFRKLRQFAAVAVFPQQHATSNHTRTRWKQAQHGKHRGGFSAAGFANQSQDFTAPDGERNVLHRGEGCARRSKLNCQPLDFEQRLCHARIIAEQGRKPAARPCRTKRTCSRQI